jgi:hypothetical protein
LYASKHESRLQRSSWIPCPHDSLYLYDQPCDR